MALLPPFSQPGRFWRGNLHCHSRLSDGALPPEAVVEAYRAAGYDFMVLSDHFMARYNWPVADTRDFRKPGFTTLIGAELHAPATSIGEIWHILATGLPLGFAPLHDGETGPDIARRAHAAGALITIAHPAWSQLTLEDARSIDCAHAVEVYNHVGAKLFDRSDGWVLLEQCLRDGRRLNAIASDDAHFKFDDHFGGWVHVKSESLDPDALLEALKRGHHYSSQGPLIESLELDGRKLHVRCSPADAIIAVGASCKGTRQMGRAITSATLDLSGLEGGWFRVTILDGAGKRAWSNPCWWDEVS